jgi:hypothetical protein
MRLDTSAVLDLTHEQQNPPRVQGKHQLARGKVVLRDMSKVTGVTVHQTAVEFGVGPQQIAAAGGDRNLALARRALNVACHAMAFRNGMVVYANPLPWYVWHGNGFNPEDLGLEIDGLYPGLKNNPATAWRSKGISRVTPEIIKAAQIAITFLVEKGRAMGAPIEKVHAHRQSSPTRRSDPGQELWEEVVLKYAVPVLGLKMEPARVLTVRDKTTGEKKPGRPIPLEWDPKHGVGHY